MFDSLASAFYILCCLSYTCLFDAKEGLFKRATFLSVRIQTTPNQDFQQIFVAEFHHVRLLYIVRHQTRQHNDQR